MIRLSIAFSLFCIAAFFAGRVSLRYEIPALALGDLRVKPAGYPEQEEVDLSGLREFMENAVWRNGFVSWKDPADYILKDGRSLRIDELLGWFVIDGSAGYYVVRPADKDAFRRAILKRYSKPKNPPNKAPEPTPASVTPRADEGASR